VKGEDIDLCGMAARISAGISSSLNTQAGMHLGSAIATILPARRE